MTSFREISPVDRPVQGTVRPPGSKSITNRALVLAALADGTSTLTGVLDSQDTQVMIDSLRRLGIEVVHDADRQTCTVSGCGAVIPADTAELWLENSGTSMRFLTSVCVLGGGRYRLDGVKRMRERPIGDLVRALRRLGADIEFEQPESECPPLVVQGSGGRIPGDRTSVDGRISSQFLSSLLMALPGIGHRVAVDVTGTPVSQPYVQMTLAMMESFGVSVDYSADLSRFEVPAACYRARHYDIEPDASAATYLWGAAAVTGGCVTVSGLNRQALQGDVEFVEVLKQMGCRVDWHDEGITVSGPVRCGVDVDMNAISDTAQTLAAVAVFADSPTTIRGVQHMRHKETDRVAAVVTELRRAGIRAEETEDGMTIHPGTPQPASIRTYDDHRMAMSFALLGLRVPGIRILDPDCTAKTYPHYFDDLDHLCREAL